MSQTPAISVVIRTRNEAKGLPAVLDGIASQKWEGKVEVIVVDSGSTDGTAQIARSAGARVIEIDPASFSFGRALNTGIEAAGGELISILNGHTTPRSDDLFSLLARHFENPRVAGVGGREGPGRACNPCEAHDRDDYYPIRPTPGKIVFSNGNSMVRRSVWERFRFDEELPGTEDLEWATRVTKAGYRMRYEPAAAVTHCHTASLRYLYRRFYREESWIVSSGFRWPLSMKAGIKFWIRRSLSDAKYLVRTRMNPAWVFYIPLYRGAQALATFVAGRRATPPAEATRIAAVAVLQPSVTGEGAEPLATVAILTFNGEALIVEVLNAVFAQDTDFPFEVLVIDSGSKDNTVEILKGYPGIRLIEIPNEEFGHGRTRNFAAENSRGEFVAFLTQDATPATEDWLKHLVEGFALDPKVAAVYGPHLPRGGADPKTVKDLADFFWTMGPQDRPTTQTKDYYFFSDVNGCIRKSIWKQIRYRDLPYAEDQAFGKDVLLAGYHKVYEPRAAVIHSHSYPPIKNLKRLYDEWMGIKISLGITEKSTLGEVFTETRKAIKKDARDIWEKKEAPSPVRLRWLLRASHMNFSQRLAPFLVYKDDELPGWLRRRLSFEKSWKRKLARTRSR